MILSSAIPDSVRLNTRQLLVLAATTRADPSATPGSTPAPQHHPPPSRLNTRPSAPGNYRLQEPFVPRNNIYAPSGHAGPTRAAAAAGQFVSSRLVCQQQGILSAAG